MWQYLTDVAQLTADDVFQVNGPVNLNRLLAIPDMVDRPDLKYPLFVPRVATATSGALLAAIRERDHLTHHPYNSFVPVVELLSPVAPYPQVRAIKKTMTHPRDDWQRATRGK